MSTENGHQKRYEDSFKQVAVEFVDNKCGSVEAVAIALGVEASDLRVWKSDLAGGGKPVKTLSEMAQLRAENEALRNQIVSLQVQWDILKTTLGMLSTTVCTREAA